MRELKNPPLLSVGFLYLLVPVCMGNMLTFLRVRVLVTVQLRCQKEVIGPGTKASRLRNAAPCGEANNCKVVRLSYSSTLQISKQRAGEADTVLGRTKAKSSASAAVGRFVGSTCTQAKEVAMGSDPVRDMLFFCCKTPCPLTAQLPPRLPGGGT